MKRRVADDQSLTYRLTQLLAFTLCLTQGPALAGGLNVILEHPTFGEGNAALLGQGMDVEGNFAVVSAPAVKELHFYTKSITTGQWSSGLTISLPSAATVGPGVALGDDLAIYYSIGLASPPNSSQVRRRTLGIGGTDEEVFTQPDLRAPDSLAVKGNLLVAGWRPRPGFGAGYRVMERVGENWTTAFGLTVGPDLTDIRQPGFAVDTDGIRIATTDPLAGDHGSVTVHYKDGAQWTVTTMPYENPLQGNVHFGSAVALDGDCLAVGMDQFDSGSVLVPGSTVVDSGGVQMLSRQPGAEAWNFEQSLVPEAVLAGDGFATDLAMDGPFLVIAGENAQRINATTPGDVSLFGLAGNCRTGTWSERARLRSTPLVFDPSANGAFGGSVGLSQEAGILVFDYLGPTGELHGRGYVYDGLMGLFEDGFESGDTQAWSTSTGR